MNHRVCICRSNPIAPDPRVEKIARCLAAAGWQVTALGWNHAGVDALHEQREGYGVERISRPLPKKRGLGNLPHLLGWQLDLWRWLAGHHTQVDVIHACDLDTLFPALACRLLWRTKVVYDIFDFYADMLRATPGWLVSLVRALELSVIGRVDALILADDSRYEQIAGSHPRRVTVVYNSPEDEAVIPWRGSKTEAQLRIAYVGNLQAERGLFELLDVLRAHPDWRLELAGFGGDRERILVEAAKLPHVGWHGMIPYRQALALNAGADVLIATYDPAVPNHRYSSPNKVFEAMMLARPVIVAYGTNADRLVEQANCGLVVPYGDTAALEAALARLLEEPGLAARLGTHGRQAYELTYSWARMKVRLLNLYEQVTGEV